MPTTTTTTKATFTGTVEWEYDESGSKTHDVVIRVRSANGRTCDFPTGIRVFLWWGNPRDFREERFSVYSDGGGKTFRSKREVESYINELLRGKGWQIDVEEKGSYEI